MMHNQSLVPFSSPTPNRELSSSITSSSPSSPCIPPQFDPNPRKKRSKMVKVDPGGTTAPKPRTVTRKPDPNAPKITRPCTECGKKFWSWKALFGHMRCHPERQWRGINPPLNLLRSPLLQPPMKSEEVAAVAMSEEDHEVAECLLRLANGAPPAVIDRGAVVVVRHSGPNDDGCVGSTCQQFECSSCKKVFGSHQALGGHRASHKNVKGCFAMTRSGDGSNEAFLCSTDGSSEGAVAIVGGGHHRCDICLRVFPSGQALGGHKRCHWEKGEDEIEGQFCSWDLNLPAPTVEDDSSSSYLSDLTLDLRLGL